MSNDLKYDSSQVESVKLQADIRDFVPGCSKSKAEQETECPFCHSRSMSVVHKKGKNFAFCHSCKKTLSDAIQAAMHYENMEWLPALEYVAARSGIFLRPNERTRENRTNALREKSVRSFCVQQLAASGLELSDVVAKIVTKDGSEDYAATFRPGSIDPPFNPVDSGDDMLIYYYGLDGKQKTYVPKGNNGRAKPYVRVRWSNPAAHTDADGKETKYRTPPGAPSQCYIPQIVRDKFNAGEHIETLFIQEGEKKAEKACKHGMISIGIQGINNFGTAKDGLLPDIQNIVKFCTVRNVVLVMDSDWQDLKRNIVTGDNVTNRPNSFAKAVIKFRQFIRSLANINVDADAWWGHVNANPAGDKGVDDLLAGSLKEAPHLLMESAAEAMNAHNGKSRWINIHRITSVTDRQIEDYWLLNDAQAFYECHADRLKDIDTFQIRHIQYSVRDGVLVPVTHCTSDIGIWSIERDSKDREKVVFNTLEAFEFLKSNGFSRLRTLSSEGVSSYEYIRIRDGIIEKCSPVEIRDFVRDYVRTTCRKNIVKNYFYEKMDSILGDKKMENLECIDNDFNNFDPQQQFLFYNNGAVKISSDGISPNLPFVNVWRSQIRTRRFTRVPVIESIVPEGDSFKVTLTEQGRKCEFFRYLHNTSNTFYHHDSPRKLQPEEQAELNRNIVNKITSIGYLLCEYKFRTEAKAVVVQDHMMSEVGQSNGGSGKSIIGNAISYITSQVFIDGKDDDSNNKFFLNRVGQSTRNIFIDDIRVNFNFERLFAMITGNMIIERKNQDAIELKFSESPKFLITTNHTINKATENATARRLSYMEVSEWYSPSHNLMDDFGHMFFEDWEPDGQWKLFDNLMAECVMYYLRSMQQGWGDNKGEGMVKPAMQNIMLRSYRQEMGEAFLQWAEEYFDPEGINLNQRRSRKEMFDAFAEYTSSGGGQGVSRSNFRRKLEAFCKFRGYDLNTMRPNDKGEMYIDWKPRHPSESFIGGQHKTGSLEYFTVFSEEKRKSEVSFN